MVTVPMVTVPTVQNRLLHWFLERESDRPHPHPSPEEHPWWQVVCLTGVDYFSTLGYQPGIAALAAGELSPLATLILVLVTLFGALPIYRKVAHISPHGEGSIAMLEHLLPWWQGKLLVLCLLGFVATDFIITITLSAADATAHLLENPLVPHGLHGQAVPITLVLIALLGAVFLQGFREAIGIAVVLVVVYLSLNAITIVRALGVMSSHPSALQDWHQILMASPHSHPLRMIAIAALLFPKLALGLSGFETGVAVMPLVKGKSSDTYAFPRGRIHNTERLLTFAALVMSVFLLTSSVVTTLLIEPSAFQPGGPANGRALAYLAHTHLGNGFGTLYDISTIAILWFAGASAMAGLLNIVPRYLPRYGMAPNWASRSRPLVVVFTTIAFVVTVLFKANVDAQGGAYATGVLVLMTSAALAVTLHSLNGGETSRGDRSPDRGSAPPLESASTAYPLSPGEDIPGLEGGELLGDPQENSHGGHQFPSPPQHYPRRKTRHPSWEVGKFGLITLVFVYTTLVNIAERPDGVKIASFFIGSIIITSLVSRIWRSTELRAESINLDPEAKSFISTSTLQPLRIIAHRPRQEGIHPQLYAAKVRTLAEDHHLPATEQFIFLEVQLSDASEFLETLDVRGYRVGDYRVLRLSSAAVPNAIAALLLRLRDETGQVPHAYFGWVEGNPLQYMMRYLLFGEGDTAIVTREVLRRAERHADRRPVIHVGG